MNDRKRTSVIHADFPIDRQSRIGETAKDANQPGGLSMPIASTQSRHNHPDCFTLSLF